MDIIVDHNGGFFSCCAVRLGKICEFINIHHKMPSVDSSKQFNLYKLNNNDITFDYFNKYQANDKDNFDIVNYVDFHWEHQFMDYSKLKFLIVFENVRL